MVTIRTRDGGVHSERVGHSRGHAARGGVTWDDLDAIWSEALPDQDVGSWISRMRKLEDLEHVGEVLQLFTEQP
ncbi:hypothetical protein [Streptomyces sp. NPDC101234]|uniref:hypothetical protein n=1 Tax=Streptomyces sp. NPDC101234 TaxID=3366138 RepID=UPI00380857A6